MGRTLGGKCQPGFFLVLPHRRTPCTVSSSPGSCQARASASVRTVARRPVGNRYTVPQTRFLPLVSFLVNFPEPPGQLMTDDGGILVRLDPDLMGSWDASDHIKRRAEPFKGEKRRSKIRGQSFSPQGYTSSLEQIPLFTWVPGPV